MFNLILAAASAKEVFTYIGYVIVAILALMLMIIIHESGHYLAGKILGFKIDEFSIGFGPAIFQRKNKKTGEIFSIRPIPIGGFCAFHGEDEEESGKQNPYINQEIANDGRRGILAYLNDDMAVDADKIEPFDEVKEDKKKGVLPYLNENKGLRFNDQPAWKRLIVLFSGAFFNFLSAIFIITIYFTAYGQILPVVANTYDVESGMHVFQEGDVVLAVNGKQVNIMVQDDLYNTFANLGDTATFKVLRDGEAIELTVHKQNYTYTETKKDDAGNEYETTETKYGFGIAYGFARVKLSFFRAFGRAFGFCFFIVFKILASLGALITGKVGIETAGGTITVVKTIAEVSSAGFDAFLYVVAVISANLAVMNLLPIPALDGSRMLFTFIEMIFRKPVPRKIEGIIHTVGLGVLLILVVFLDVFHLVSGV